MCTDRGDTEPVDDEVPYFAVQYDEEREALLDKVHWDLSQDRPDGCHALEITPEKRDAASISVEEFLRAQAGDAFCRFAAKTVGTPSSKFDIDRYGFLVRKSPLDGTLQRVVPTQLRPRVLYLAHHPRLAGPPGATPMYYTLRREYYWPHMASDSFSTVRNCTSCAAIRGTLVKSQKDLKLFPATGPLEFVAMDLLGPCPRPRTATNTFWLLPIGSPS